MAAASVQSGTPVATRHRRHAVLYLLGAAIAIAAVAAAAAMLIYSHNTGWMYDAKVYRAGGAAALQGQDLYASLRRPGFTYTPFAALLFIPLSLPPLALAAWAWTAVSIVCLEGTVWLCLGLLKVGGRWRPVLTVGACLLAFWLDGVGLTLLLGQINLVLMFAVVADLSRSDRSRWKGIGIGMAAGVKLIPAFFILYLLVTRRIRAAGVALAALAATVVVGFVALPEDSARYWGGIFLDSARVGDPQNVRSQSLQSVLVRWMHTTQGIRPTWLALGVLVTVVGMGLAAWAHRRGDELLAICICGTATLLISPITWQHHWVWMLPLLLWLAHRAWRTRSRLAWAAAGLVAIEFYARPYQWGVPVDRTLDLRLDPGQLILTSTYAASAVAALALIALALWRDARRDSSPALSPG